MIDGVGPPVFDHCCLTIQEMSGRLFEGNDELWKIHYSTSFQAITEALLDRK